MKLRILALCLIGLAAAIAPSALKADTPGAHPAYLRARSNLRAAQFLLRIREESMVRRHMVEADREVEAAIREIDRAAVIDRKDIDDHPPADERLDRIGRFRKTVELLRTARAELAREEDNGRARGWRNVAYLHIDQALEHVHKAAIELHWERDLGF
jgi:hypothetical protein